MKASVVQLPDAVVLKCEVVTVLNCEPINTIIFITSFTHNFEFKSQEFARIW